MGDNLDKNLLASNYCVSFIDLLGQKEALKNQALLPPLSTLEEQKQFQEILKKSVLAIADLQKDADLFLRKMLPNPNSLLRTSLSSEEQLLWDELINTQITTQRWSDGLMSFVRLSDASVRCPMNGIWGLFLLAGVHCLFGLAQKKPLRGAIEVAWGVELHPGELYGAALVRAYELESEVAQYPRIVVGSETVNLIKIHSSNSATDNFSLNNKGKAKSCLEMLIQDSDGHWILHYLGDEFKFCATHDCYKKLYNQALIFIREQMVKHKTDSNTKLAFRYSQLLKYFDDHPPSKS